MRLCADIGGSHVRVAVTSDDHREVSERWKEPVEKFEGGDKGAVMAIHAFIQEHKQLCDYREIRDLIICAAGPIKDRRVQLTNSNWRINADQMRDIFSNTLSKDLRVSLINDYEALAYGLTVIEDEDYRTVYDRECSADTKIVCGPGTGFGLATLRESSDGSVSVLRSEGGHQSAPSESPREVAFYEWMKKPVVTYEEILSGNGLSRLYKYYYELHHARATRTRTPKQICEDFLENNDAIAREALEHFACVFGTFCGNMVLALGAQGGVYLWGGILKSFPQEMLELEMKNRFLSRGGAAGHYVADVFIRRITNPNVALRGCSVYAALS